MPLALPALPVRNGAQFCCPVGRPERSQYPEWVKPGAEVFQIHYKGNTAYEPDYVVETRTAKLICNIRQVQEIETSEVQDKANAAAKWCEYATAHEKQNGGKPWSYLLIPEDAVQNRLTWAVWRTRLKIEFPEKFHELFG